MILPEKNYMLYCPHKSHDETRWSHLQTLGKRLSTRIKKTGQNRKEETIVRGKGWVILASSKAFSDVRKAPLKLIGLGLVLAMGFPDN